MSEHKLHVVNLIPTYNESENILRMLEVLDEIAENNPKYKFSTLVVDDNSPDGTGLKVEHYLKENPNVYLLTGKKRGLGAALIKGYKYAMDELKADVIVSNDCDFQFDPFEIPRLLEKIDEGYDVVIASRHTPGGDVVGWPVGRRFTHFMANTFFAKYVAGIKEVTDHQGNFRAMRVAGALDKIDLDSIPVIGYGFLNYMIYRFSLVGAHFAEVPITFKWRQFGETKVSFTRKYFKTFLRDTHEYIKVCLKIRTERSQQSRQGSTLSS